MITYCDSGISGAGAARTLAKLGFTKVFNLEGGLNAWVKDNLPLIEDRGGRQGQMRNEPAARHHVRDGLVSVLPARARPARPGRAWRSTEIDVDDDAKLREEMVARSGRRTVPQIFIGD